MATGVGAATAGVVVFTVAGADVAAGATGGSFRGRGLDAGPNAGAAGNIQLERCRAPLATDALDHPAAQILLDALLGGWRGAGEHLRPELKAELPVLNPPALGREPFAGADRRQRADHGHEVTVALGLDPEHAVAVFFFEKGNALNQAGKAFGERCWPLDVQSRNSGQE